MSAVGLGDELPAPYGPTCDAPVERAANTLAEFVAATGHEDHGRGGNPRFRNAAAGNFALTAGSPAI